MNERLDLSGVFASSKGHFVKREIYKGCYVHLEEAVLCEALRAQASEDAEKARADMAEERVRALEESSRRIDMLLGSESESDWTAARNILSAITGGMNVLSLFDGMSCGRIALEKAGIKVNNYFACEIEKNAIAVSKANWDDVVQLGDVTKIQASSLPKIDLIIGGSPCQGFSFAGKMLNFEDPKSRLFFEFVRLVKECKPAYFLLENNRMKKKFSDVITQHMGAEPLKINSALVSAQNRARLYWTNIPNATIPEDKKIFLRDLIGDYEGVWVYPRGWNKGGVKDYKGKSPTMTISSWQHNFFIFRNGAKEKFSVETCEALQCVPIGYTAKGGVSENARYKMLGNGWTVDVIAHILGALAGGEGEG